MPVVLENGSDQIRTWLDPKRSEWSKELQSLLKPYDRELECYVVSKEVGKVGNNSPDFIVPVASSENKSNIANFFVNAKKPGKEITSSKPVVGHDPKRESDANENRSTIEQPRSEDNAPMPAPPPIERSNENKRPRPEDTGSLLAPSSKAARMDDADHGYSKEDKIKAEPETKKNQTKRKTKSATSNNTVTRKSPRKAGDNSQKITSFFSK